MLGLPSYQVLMLPKIPLGLSDYIIGGLSLTVLTLEFIADNQQWSFQNFKQSGKIKPNEWFGANIEWTEHDRKRGFITRGLWAWSRHPNFFCEQSFWVGFSWLWYHGFAVDTVDYLRFSRAVFPSSPPQIFNRSYLKIRLFWYPWSLQFPCAHFSSHQPNLAKASPSKNTLRPTPPINHELECLYP